MAPESPTKSGRSRLSAVPLSQDLPRQWSLVRASGDIDLATVDELDQALRAAACEDQPAHHLVLDLTAVTFLDCAGLSPIVAARRRLADRFWIANPPPQVCRLLTLTGLTEAFAYLDDVPPITLVPGHRTAGGPGG